MWASKPAGITRTRPQAQVQHQTQPLTLRRGTHEPDNYGVPQSRRPASGVPVVSGRIVARMQAGSAPRRQTSMIADAGVEIAWEMAEEFGAPTLEHYRRVYAACGVPWPGDDEVRRLLPVAVHS